MFDRLENRYCLEGVLNVHRALHVGSGSPLGDVDMPVVRDGRGKPYVPGSSLRGVIRSAVERSVSTLAPARSCVLFDDDAYAGPCPSTNREAGKVILKLMEKGKASEARGILFGTNEEPGRLCDTCRLFGSAFAASKLKIFDLRCVAPPVGRFVRHGVGIDRDTGTAHEGIKFEYEAVEPAVNPLQFEFGFVAENLEKVPTGADFALLGLALIEAKRGLAIGGKTGSGLGDSRLEINRVRYFDNAKSHGLRQYLKTKENDGYSDMKAGVFEDEIAKELERYLELYAEAAHA